MSHILADTSDLYALMNSRASDDLRNALFIRNS